MRSCCVKCSRLFEMALVSFRLSNLFLICFKLFQLLWVVVGCKRSCFVFVLLLL